MNFREKIGSIRCILSILLYFPCNIFFVGTPKIKPHGNGWISGSRAWIDLKLTVDLAKDPGYASKKFFGH